ncbi:TetR/AcrR family transcriptional regulator [Glutamicibacter sp. Je.9.36]|uniref:TetR/AcrR family transcriptional regulator n=1 Tax=Glutamicibacter sp. Je.9.36 TaxID=3142837 RepID=UPI003DA957C1
MQTEAVEEQAPPSRSEVRQAEIALFLDALNRWTDAKSKAAPVYKRGVNTRMQIIEAARRVFVRMGYIDTSVEDLLHEAGISRATFYSHFRSKKAVFASVVEEHVRGRLSQTNVTNVDKSDYRGKVTQTIERFMNNYTNTQDLSLVIEQVAHYDEEFRNIRLVIRDLFIDRIARGIRRQQAAGAVAESVNARDAATLVLSMMTNIAQVEIGWKKRKPTADLIEMMTNFWCAGIGWNEH